MTALVRMRLTAFVRTGRALAPAIAGVVVLTVLYGGGSAQAAEAYGVSAVVLFPVLAWQSKLLLDAEPDVQRRLALATLASPARELAAGLAAAAVAGAATTLVALALPWPLGGVAGPKAPDDLPLAQGVALGVWAHALALPAAVALGALASRAVTRSAAYGIAVLMCGVVGTIVLGLRGSVAPWAVPPVMGTARALIAAPGWPAVAGLTTHALLWTVLAGAGYAWLRRTRT